MDTRLSGTVPAIVETAKHYVALTKPGILTFLLLTALTSMVVAQGGVPDPGRVAVALLGLALSCGGANAVNMWYDQDIDRIMRRTRRRPIPSGHIPPEHALVFGIAAEAASFAVLAAGVNLLAAFLALAGYLYYVVIYTFWLKRRSPQNIVIGGAAGAFPPLVGWAAITGHLSLASILLFLIIFLWTPPHFWSLALYNQDDYRAARIPMLPVVKGEAVTKRQSLAYTLALAGASIALWMTGRVGTFYLVVASALNAGFVVQSILLLREQLPHTAVARRTFRFSLVYLLGLFLAMMASPVPR